MRLRSLAPLLGLALLAACGSAGASEPAAPLATLAPRPSATAGPPAPPTAAPAEPTAAQAEASPAPSDTAAPAPTAAPATLDELALGIAPVVEGLSRPTHVTSAGDGSGRLFVTEQAGRVVIIRDGARLEAPFLDLLALVGANGNEQGLLSVAFHPQYAENSRLFVNYTDRGGDTVVAEYRVSAADPDRADPASARVLLTIEQPAPNHNGGLLKFGPDGYLYVGTGDGGAAGDPWGNGQSRDTLLGKILRVDVDSGDPYGIPADNPFADGAGGRPEIWAYGLRNPWRFSFDRATGDLYIADVGQNQFEEVHFQPAGTPGGRNYGWDTMEANACFERANCEQAGLELPIAVYNHNSREGGCSITGGYVYRGAQFPRLAGTYVYADFCSGNLWALQPTGDAWQSRLVTTIDIRTSSFGEDEAGELYLTDRDGGGLYRLVVE